MSEERESRSEAGKGWREPVFPNRPPFRNPYYLHTARVLHGNLDRPGTGDWFSATGHLAWPADTGAPGPNCEILIPCRTWNYIELSIPYLLLTIVVGNFGTKNVYRPDICFSTWWPSVNGASMEEVTFDQRYDQINKSWLFRTVSMVMLRNNCTLQLKKTVFSSFRSQR